jgi:hypothetical protein
MRGNSGSSYVLHKPLQACLQHIVMLHDPRMSLVLFLQTVEYLVDKMSSYSSLSSLSSLSSGDETDSAPAQPPGASSSSSSSTDQ